MKILLLVFLYITSAKGGVLKDYVKKSDSVSNADYRLHEVQVVTVSDFYQIDHRTISITEVLIDVTKDKENQTNTIVSDTSKMLPGRHVWKIKFLTSQQPAEEIDRILHVIELAAMKIAQPICGTCATGDIEVRCELYIDFVVPNESKTKVQKREIKIQNSEPTDLEEINRILRIVEAAGNKTGEADGKNCTTVDGTVFCNVYLPAESSHQPSNKYKREIDYQSNTQLIDEDEVIPDTANATTNTTVDTVTNCKTVECLFDNTAFLVGDECPPGKRRADDGTCLEIFL